MEEIKTSIRNKSKRRKNRKIAWLFSLTGITAIILIVETYAWFIGTGSVYANEFQIGVSAGENLLLSLDGATWDDTIDISEAAIAAKGADSDGKSYEGNTNHWAGQNGLVPVSTDGAVTPEVGRLKLYGKSSITATPGGFRLISTQIDNYNESATEKDGYVAFDMFIKNGSGTDYIPEYNELDDEAIYLTKDSSVEAIPSGEKNYGLANSVRVAFVQVGRVASTTQDTSTITSISCAEDISTNTPLCEDTKTTIWEPNDTKHDSNLVSYFTRVCKQKQLVTPEGGGTAEIKYGTEPCAEVKDGTATNTYVVNKNITSSDSVDVYDGLNGFTVGTDYKLTLLDTFTDTEKVGVDSERPAFFKLAANSITKIRVYIYLEGQDVDNYDLASLGETIKIKFGFTKDQLDLASEIETTSQAS